LLSILTDFVTDCVDVEVCCIALSISPGTEGIEDPGDNDGTEDNGDIEDPDDNEGTEDVKGIEDPVGNKGPEGDSDDAI